jgi:hypothetical protein
MQVEFTPNELQVLTEILARHNRDLVHEIARTDDREFKHMLQEKLELLTRLQNQIVWGELQLSTEKSEVLAEVLDQCERALYFEIARTDDREFKHMLQKNLESLECAHHKITGASAAA